MNENKKKEHFLKVMHKMDFKGVSFLFSYLTWYFGDQKRIWHAYLHYFLIKYQQVFIQVTKLYMSNAPTNFRKIKQT